MDEAAEILNRVQELADARLKGAFRVEIDEDEVVKHIAGVPMTNYVRGVVQKKAVDLGRLREGEEIPAHWALREVQSPERFMRSVREIWVLTAPPQAKDEGKR